MAGESGFLASAIALVKFLFGGNLSRATFAPVEGEGESEGENGVGGQGCTARENARGTERARNNVKQGRISSVPQSGLPEESGKGDDYGGGGYEGCRPDGTREVRLAAVPRVVMRN